MLSSRPAHVERAGIGELRELAIDDSGWQEFSGEHPDALAFHNPRWARLLVDCYRYRPFVLAAVDEGGGIAGGLPVVEVRSLRRRRWIALPFTDMCPPLLAPGLDQAAFASALDLARRTGGVPSFEVRGRLESDVARTSSDAVVHMTELGTDPDALFASFHKSQVQRNVRRAEREELVVRLGDEERDLTRTYYALHAETRRRLGTPVQPRRFFTALWRHMLAPGLGRLLLVYSGDRAIAGAVFLAGSETLTYKFGASDSAFWRVRPNHLLFWTAIRWAIETGFRRLDFGRSDLEDQGLRDFKGGWAATEEPLVYTSFGTHASSVRSGRSLNAARVVLRRSPVWVGRAAGELFYRRAA
jgi:CelD/BcsL family acetyltransferase involved in cellulose biosynthesis